MPHRSVLIVEDTPDVREVMEEALRSAAYEVQCADDAPSGRAAIDAIAPNIVICDLGLRGREDGLSLARYASERSCAVLLVTGNHAARERLEASGFAYLLKPFSIVALVKAVETLLRIS